MIDIRAKRGDGKYQRQTSRTLPYIPPVTTKHNGSASAHEIIRSRLHRRQAASKADGKTTTTKEND